MGIVVSILISCVAVRGETETVSVVWWEGCM